MKHLLLIGILALLISCASNSNQGDSSQYDRTQPIVLKCSDGWAKCYSTANEICGSRGFDELDRAQDGHLTAAGRVDEQGSSRGVYREDLRFEGDQQTLVIQCK